MADPGVRPETSACLHFELIYIQKEFQVLELIVLNELILWQIHSWCFKNYTLRNVQVLRA